ncbi:hypothetical protein Zmor_000237 [Zophobas morio]|uniref:No apical meristem-associated C-terminal domain-containing protein n=1 Tax=Zophobas morio TaxID=2755281 RepID=A0AA38MR34_9CUCU|nr:hypothetical protein Zmor_000237 [Zophobas morio]
MGINSTEFEQLVQYFADRSATKIYGSDFPGKTLIACLLYHKLITFRDHKVLNKKYDNIKKRTTKKFADEKAYVGGTGRGSQQSIEATDVDVAVKEILGAKPMGHSSEFDGDSETTSFQSNSENGQTGNWAKYSPKILKQKKFSALTPYRRGKGNQTSDNLEQCAAAKELVELSRKEYIQKEQEFKLKAMKEKHELEMQIMRDKAALELEVIKQNTK